MSRYSFVRCCLLLTCLLGLQTATLFGQENRGTIFGHVIDPSGAAVPGATIRVTNVETGIVSTTKSEDTGNYTIPFLPPGKYSVIVEAAGFAPVENTGAQLHAQENLRLDFDLKTGTLKEKVSVTARAVALETASTATGQTMDTQAIVELPILNRNTSNLTLLGAGVTTSTTAVSAILSGLYTGGVSASGNGIRDSANQYTVDGANVNVGFYNYPSFVPVPDAIQEFSVQTGNYSAEYGQFAGAHVDYVLKSGTNAFHGAAWEYLRNDALDSRNTFATSVTKLKQNQFGGMVSGPIRKNKTFFMGMYQGLKIAGGTLIAGIVPTAVQRSGDLSYNWDGSPVDVPVIDPVTQLPFDNNTIPQARFSPVSVKVMDVLMPQPNVTGQAGFNYQNQASTPQTGNQYLIKIDHAFSDHDQFYGRYAFNKSTTFNSTKLTVGKGEVTTYALKTQNVAMGYSHVFSPTVVLSTRFSYNRQFLTETYPENGTNLDTRSLFGMTIPSSIGPGARNNEYPNFQISGFSNIGSWVDTPTVQPDENYEMAGALAVIRGKHSLKFGAELFRYRSARLQCSNVNGGIGFSNTNSVGSANALGDFLLGMVDSSYITIAPNYPDLRRTNAELYMADKWSVSRKLTLSLGLRYEFNTPGADQTGRLSRFVFDNGGAFLTLEPREPLFQVGHTNFAPRVGLTYQLPKNTVVRASYGIFFDETPLLLYAVLLPGNPPFSSSYSFQTSAAAPIDIADPWPVGLEVAGGLVGPRGIQYKRGSPYANEWMLDVQHSFGKDLVFAVAYVGNHGLKGLRLTSLNLPQSPVPLGESFQAYRPMSNWGGIAYQQFDLNSSYNALQARLEKHFSQGLYLLASYTWSKNLTGAGWDSDGGQLFPDNLNADWGPSTDMDHRHNFKLTYVYELPVGHGRRFASSTSRLVDAVIGGWQLSGSTAITSGIPFTVWSTAVGANVGLGTRPLRTCNGNLGGAATIDRWFDESCFVDPPLYSYGNSGRGILTGPGYQSWDVGLMKSFRTFKEQRLQIRAEAFNAFNNVNYGLPGAYVGVNVTSTGKISSAGPARVIQLGAKYTF